jgi:hypothetical protein
MDLVHLAESGSGLVRGEGNRQREAMTTYVREAVVGLTP